MQLNLRTYASEFYVKDISKVFQAANQTMTRLANTYSLTAEDISNLKIRQLILMTTNIQASRINLLATQLA